MTDLNCKNCGMEIMPGTRFCRQCGQPAPDTSTTSVTEGTTRVLHSFADDETPTRHFYSTPAGGPPVQVDASAQARSLAAEAPAPKRKSKFKIISVVSVLLVMMIVIPLGVVALRWNSAGRTVRSGAPSIGIPPVPAAPNIPGVPTIGDDLRYPGATTIMDIRKANRQVIQLSTSDSLDKVVNWYEAKINPKERVRIGGAQAVLKSDQYSVVINGNGSQTQILIGPNNR